MNDYAFKVTCGGRIYTVTDGGKVAGFDPMGGPVLIENRIPLLIAEAVREAIAAEREACAKIAEGEWNGCGDWFEQPCSARRHIAAAIRARGQTT